MAEPRRRAREDSPRPLLVGALIATALALITDTTGAMFTLTEYRTCGHLHFHLLLTVMGLSLTIAAVHLWTLCRRGWNRRARGTDGRRGPPSERPGPPSESSGRSSD